MKKTGIKKMPLLRNLSKGTAALCFSQVVIIFPRTAFYNSSDILR